MENEELQLILERVENFFRAGYSYRIYPGIKFNTKKIHVRAYIDKFWIVFAWYGQHKQYWHYEVESILFFDSLLEKDQIIARGKNDNLTFKFQEFNF